MAILKFNIKQIKLVEEFENSFNCFSDQWDNKFKDMPVSEVVELGHKVLKSDKFLKIYKQLVECVEELIGQELCCQKRPTFRLQRKFKKSVDFHTDEILSGHPPNMVNIWIPLRKTFLSNGMWIVNENNTKELLDDFQKKKWSIDTLNKNALQLASPQVMQYGDILTFNNKNLHGTIVSKEDIVRYSIDFRMLPKSEIKNMGKKKYGLDYIDLKNIKKNLDKNDYKKGISILYTNHKADIYSHPIQRAMVDQFATANSIIIEREVAEWQVSHFPQIYAVLKEHPDHVIIFATKRSFNQEDFQFKELCKELHKHTCPVYFALEDEKLN